MNIRILLLLFSQIILTIYTSTNPALLEAVDHDYNSFIPRSQPPRDDSTPNTLAYRGRGPGRLYSSSQVTTNVIESRCLVSWEDSHQVHSQETIIEWDYQAVKTTMKKLTHCVRLNVVGPIDVEGLSKQYVNECVQNGLNHNRTRHILEGIIALGVDILSKGATGGSVTAAKLADYVKSVVDNTIECLTDTEQVTSFIKAELQAKFNATVKNESQWEYWEL